MTRATPGPQALGESLRTRRDALGRSLKAIAEPAEISVAYLVKLERGEVAAPSPHVLRRLAHALSVEYVALMELAGYISPGREVDANTPRGAIKSAALTEDEAVALSAYLEVYRANKQQ